MGFMIISLCITSCAFNVIQCLNVFSGHQSSNSPKHSILNYQKKKPKRQQKGKLLPSQMSECRIWCYNMQIFPSATDISSIIDSIMTQLCGVVCRLFHYHRRSLGLRVCRTSFVRGHACMSVLCRLYVRMCVVYSCKRRGFNELQWSVPLSISVYQDSPLARRACSPQEEETTSLPNLHF